jgi:hypothetical protein
MVWEVLAPRLDDPQLPLSKAQRWDLAAGVAGFSSELQRIADLEAYEARSVPPEARKPFLGSAADIRRNQRIARNALPDIDRWIAARESPARRDSQPPRVTNQWASQQPSTQGNRPRGAGP